LNLRIRRTFFIYLGGAAESDAELSIRKILDIRQAKPDRQLSPEAVMSRRSSTYFETKRARVADAYSSI
jgi:hypothetical protein